MMTMLSTLMAIIGQQSWRDILLTALLASSILYVFVFKNSGAVFRLSEDERSTRRLHLAKIAEERVKRIADAAASASAATDAESSSKKNKKCIKEKRKRNVSAQATRSSNEQHATTTLSLKNDETPTKTKTPASKQIAKKTTIQNNQKSIITKENECASIEVTKEVAVAQKGVDDQQKKEENESIESNKLLTEKTNAIVDVSNDEKKEDAPSSTSSIKALQANDQESTSIYLIKTSSPRIEVTIAKNTTLSELRKVVAAASDIPLTGLHLLFRGRIIVEKSTGMADEFGIEEGSALHVVRKRPEQEDSDSSSLDGLFALDYADISDVSVSHQEQQQQPTSPPRQDMTRLIHHGLLVIPNFFHYAAASGIYDVIQAAIRDGSFNMELNRADENDWTPLHEAIRGGHHQVVTLLLDEGGLDMHAITNQGNGFSPLSLSIDLHGGDHPLTRMMRDRGGQEVWPKEEESESSSSSSSSKESFDDIYS